MNPVVRRAVVRGLEVTRILPALRRRDDPNRAVVLRYHSVSEPTAANDLYRCPSIAVTPDTFERQMRFLASEYRVVPLRAIVDPLARGEPLPTRSVAITFDDGYQDNLRCALPILRAFGLPATVYVVSDAVGDGWKFWVARLRSVLLRSERTSLALGPGLGTVDLRSPSARRRAVDEATRALKALSAGERTAALDRIFEATGWGPAQGAREWIMSWDELRTMAEAGIDIGAHTRTHPILTRLSAEEAVAEIRGSRQALEQGLERPVVHFAYPNGGGVLNHDEAVARLVREAGFHSACTSVNGPVASGDDPFRLRRVGVSERHGLEGFIFNLERDRIFQLGAPSRPALVLVGPPPGGRGGISTCVASLLRSPLTVTFAVSHLSPTGAHPHYDLGAGGKLLAFVRALGSFALRVSRLRPAAVQIHASHYGDFWRSAAFVLLASLFRRPTVLMIHGSRFDDFYLEQGRLGRRLIRFVLRRPRALLVRGRRFQELLEGIAPGARVEVLHTTTDPVERSAHLPPGADPMVLFVGGSPLAADAHRKGLPDLLQAIPKVAARVPRVRFRIVGPRLEPPWTETLAGLAGANRVEFVGPVPREQVAAFYEAATVFVLPSRAEGMPNVVLEAMAHGLPVVSTAVGSIAEVLEDGLGGRLLPPGDPDALAQALVDLVSDAGTARAMGEHNRIRVRDLFSNRAMAEKLLALYRSLLGPTTGTLGRSAPDPPGRAATDDVRSAQGPAAAGIGGA